MKQALPWVLAALLVAGYVVLEIMGRQGTDWAERLDMRSKSPFGSYMFREMLPGFFPGQEVEDVFRPIDEQVDRMKLKHGTYFFLTRHLELSRPESDKLMTWAARGNTVWIAAESMHGPLLDSLHLRFLSEQEEDMASILNGREGLYPAKPTVQLNADSLAYPLLPARFYAWFIRHGSAEVLAVNQYDQPVYVRFPIGKGSILVHSIPTLFTNYYLAEGNTVDHIAGLLAAVPEGPLYWDEYYKPVRTHASAPIRYLLAQPPLRIASLLVVLFTVLYVIFKGKRTQRVIPVVTPPENASLEFARTVSGLYLERGDHTDMAYKKGKHLMEFIRLRYRMDARKLDDAAIEQLTLRSGLPETEIRTLLSQAREAAAQRMVTPGAFLEFCTLTDEFYAKSK